MPTRPFTWLDEGVTRFVSGPVYGRQALGYSPAGAMDGFSMRTGNLLLGNRPDAECLEIMLLPPRLEFLGETMIVLGGAAREAVLISGGRRQALSHARVYLAGKGDVLAFGELQYGFRTYLCFRSGREAGIIGRVRKPFAEMAHWADRDHRIRVLRGPEYRHLGNPGMLLEGVWMVSPQSNEIGIRLAGPVLSCEIANIVSEAVSDGTMQLTPSGPIVLLRHRPTLGGYPRIFNVISADVDMLAQYGPGTSLRFTEVSVHEALAINKQKQRDLAALAAECR